MAISTSQIPDYVIRTATANDIPHLGAIEKSAGSLFKQVGLDSLADDDPLPPDQLGSYLASGALWVASTSTSTSASISTEEEGEGEVVAFLACFPLNHSCTGSTEPKRFLHVAELSVHASHQRRGLASRLLRHAETQVRTAEEFRDVVGLSLTTYRDVPFNGPFYARFGFGEIDEHQILRVVGEEGWDVWEEEQGRILFPERRCFMVKFL